MAGTGERRHDVNHGQAGAEHQHGILGPHARDRRLVPRVGDQARPGTVFDAARSRRQHRPQHAAAQHGDVGGLHAAVLQPEADPLVLLADLDDVVPDPPEVDAARQRSRSFLENLGQIASVEAARHEGVSGWRNRTRGVRGHIVGPEPAQEVRRVVLERAHVGDADIEQKPIVPRRKGHAAPEGRGAVEQQDLGARPGAAEQLEGQLAAAEAGADDRDRMQLPLRRSE